jgi:Flp pilus assembly protein TadD
VDRIWDQAILAWDEQRFEDVYWILHPCLDVEPVDPYVYLYVGASLVRIHRANEAQPHLEHYRDLNPESAEAWAWLTYCFRSQQDDIAAAAAAKRTLELDPTDPVWQRLAVETETSQNGWIDINERVKRAQLASEDPTFELLMVANTWPRLPSRRVQEALKKLHVIGQLDDRIALKIAGEAGQTRQADECLRWLLQAWEIGAEPHEVFASAAFAMRKIGAYRAALRWDRRAYEIEPRTCTNITGLAISLAHVGDRDAADRFSLEALALFPFSRKARHARFLVLKLAGKRVEAVRFLYSSVKQIVERYRRHSSP